MVGVIRFLKVKMIFESSFYKEDLSKIANRITKQKVNKRRVERSLFLLERDLLVAFFYIRKLIEAKTKLTQEFLKREIKLTKFGIKPKQLPTIMNDYKFEEIYDLSNGQQVIKDLSFLCNQFTHSYILYPDFTSDGDIGSIFINSFFEREKALYKVNVDEVINLIKSCSNSYPSQAVMTYNQSKKDFEVISK